MRTSSLRVRSDAEIRNNASCLSECPVDCIRPRPEDPDFITAGNALIDPQTCIDCGVCADACPVDAIYPNFSAESCRVSAAGIASAAIAGVALSDVVRVDDKNTYELMTQAIRRALADG